jgi:hypothetical protein
MNMAGIKAKISATKVNVQKVEDKMFEVPSDYTLRTMEELGNMGQE